MNFYDFEINLVATIVFVIISYGLYVVVLGLPYNRILKKTDQPNAWLGFVPVLGEYKMSKFAYESVFKGDPTKELRRKFVGFGLYVGTTLSSTIYNFVIYNPYINSELGGYNMVGKVRQLFILLGQGEIIGVIALLSTAILTVITIVGVFNATTYTDINLKYVLLIGLGTLLIPTSLVSLVSVILLQIVAYNKNVIGKYNYEDLNETHVFVRE